MDIHKLVHEFGALFKDGPIHLPLLAGLMGVFKRDKDNLKEEISDLGDLGDNVPATLLNFLSSRRGL